MRSSIWSNNDRVRRATLFDRPSQFGPWFAVAGVVTPDANRRRPPDGGSDSKMPSDLTARRETGVTSSAQSAVQPS